MSSLPARALRLGPYRGGNDLSAQTKESPDDESRRDWLKLALAVGAGGAAGAVVAYLGVKDLEIGPLEFRDTIYYPPTPGEAPSWWSSLVGQPMRVTDFGLWQGAPGLWRQAFRAGRPVPDTGFPVLVIRIPRDDTVFSAPTDVSIPQGSRLFYDDPDREIRIVVLYNRCTHFCCQTGWHVFTIPDYLRQYSRPTPTYEVFGQDPIYCPCHDAQFDPMVLIKGSHPGAPLEYVGAAQVSGPADRPLPVVPVRTVADTLEGVTASSSWYAYCR